MSQDNLDDLGLDNPSPQGDNPDKIKQPEVLDPEIQKRDAQIVHWRDKAAKLEEENKKLNPQPAPNPQPEQKAYDPFEAVRLGKVLQGFSEEETDFILRNSKSKSIEDIQKSVQDEMVQFAITSRREKVKKENNVPSPSGSSGNVNEKSPDEIAKMSREEHIAYEKQISESQRSTQGI